MSKVEKTFRIAWDNDGVLSKSHKPVLEAVNQELSNLLSRPVNLVKSQLTDWDALTRLVFNLTGDAELATKLTGYWFDPDALRLALPNDAVIQVFERCQELPDTTQCVITTRTPVCASSTRDWLSQYLPTVDWDKDLHIRSAYDTGGGDAFKIERLQVLKIGHMTEDNSVTVARIRTELPSCGVTYISQPWNSGDVDPGRSILRAASDDPEIMYQRILESRERFFATN